MNDSATSFFTPARVRVLLLAIAAVVMFGLGWWQGRAGPVAEVATLKGQLAQAVTRAETGERERDQALASGELLQAHIAFLGAINELDQRNFGTAESQLQATKAHLEKVDPAALGLDADALASLKSDLGATSLVVAADFNEQRLRLLELDARFKTLTAKQ